ncbi:SusD/RagB family nutrient-binding outer membrane lipoprotein [Psychroflexus lacisalsi]|uniref:SusD/RagB family nutrient-binding outer membrane lipoprotein n=1 Tax=Psychroflexus lacisalsi TaxID=503928 RepID=A0ABN1KD26_9FLAO|nr:SusD/RagB family nutrient-binding outer membrane lipoprotein [Psychroflexus lacisalsi]MBZ9620124.1 SusD/RagB family nutrient-binding outer membrane lipoprotein [Psychroflexus lacisalsi]
MKKYFLTFIIACLFISCADDDKYERLNQDPKNPTEVSEDFLFTSATVSLGDFMASPNVNINVFRFISQYLTATTYVDEPNYALTNRNVPQSQWSELYRDVLLDLEDAKSNVNENELLTQPDKDARLGQIEVLQVYTWQVLVDTFGDIPYTEALQGEADNFLPVYDDAETIYVNLIERLQNARTLLSSGKGFAGADVIYGGDMSKWSKFNNSLQLRLAMRISDSNSSLSQSAAEDAASNGVFTGNQDNAIIVYQSSPPNTNPLWEDLVQSGRSDYVAANTIVDIMNDLDDPRRMYYFDENLGDGVYEGGIYGSQNPYNSSTHMVESFLDPAHPGILLDFAEVSFHLATATSTDLNYDVFGNASTHYENGITASMNYAGIDDQDAIDDYLNRPDVFYDSANSNALIGTQFWIAMYDNPIEGWSVWRKYDEPTLNLPGSTGNPVPLRYTYPINEQNLNEANYNAASQAIGGDSQQTRLFWDVN